MTNERGYQKMKKRLFKKLALLVCFSALIFNASIASVHASVSEGPSKTVTVFGHTYRIYSAIEVQSDWNTTVATSTVRTPDPMTRVPAGYMGSLSRIYKSSGSLHQSSDWVYNQSTTSGLTNYAYANTSGTYYSYGLIELYNGNGYSLHTTNRTPNRTLNSVEQIPPIGINSNGESYGSGLYEILSDVKLDLIQAEGIDGTVGYVRSTDLEVGKFNSPEEAVVYQATQKNSNGRTIPLYDADGETIIGNFKIQAPSFEIFD